MPAEQNKNTRNLLPFLGLMLGLMLLSFSVTAQNLVRNPSFESFSYCPEILGDIDACDNWHNPVATNPDFFHGCSSGFYTHTPVNIAGAQQARSGKGYTGIIIYQKGDPWKEYLQGELSEPLVKGKNYEISFWVCPGEMSSYFGDQLGVHFTAEDDFDPEAYFLSPDTRLQTVSGPKGYFYDDPDKWTQFTQTYEARGGEEFIVIGNFEPYDYRRKMPLNPRTENLQIEGMAYVFLDDVRLIPHDFEEKPVDSLNPHLPSQMVLNEEVVLAQSEEIFIGEEVMNERQLIRKYGLGVESQVVAIDYFAYFLKIYPEINVEIGVHTDDEEEDEDYNLELTTKQAESLVNYLYVKGISKGRLTPKGYGSKEPIANNDTAEGQDRNRRVSFKVTSISSP